MVRHIGSAAVVGAGTMGAQIAAHFANVGIPVVLLDRAPDTLTPEEESKGLSLTEPRGRNRIVREAFERARALKPSPFFVARNAERITLGNTSDDMGRLAEADWIVEAVVERMDVKRGVLRQIEAHARPDAYVTSNTSGLSIAAMSAGCGPDFRARFCGTHFFNPPRYLHLLEIIPTADTRQEIVDFLADFGRRVLGKGIVICRDTPYFIGNRIGCFAQSYQVLAARKAGLGFDAADAITGEPLLRPRSATFRLCDIVGIDLMIDVGENLHAAVPDDPWRELFLVPDFVQEMVRRGWRGEKSGQGFYKRVRGAGGSEILTLSLEDWEYHPRQKASFPSLSAARKIPDPAARLRTMLGLPSPPPAAQPTTHNLQPTTHNPDPASLYAWDVVSHTLVYAANLAAEISEDLARVDDAMRWGWNWELGPFEQWDALGVAEVVRRLEEEGREVPGLARRALADGGSFYRKGGGRTSYLGFGGGWVEKEPPPGVVSLAALKDAGKTVAENPDASLIDLGDGVLCLEAHSKLNTMGQGVLEMIQRAVREVEANFAALVIGNEGKMFSAGANLSELLATAEAGNWDQIHAQVRRFQDTLMSVKCCARPVVSAVFRQALGGGCEMTLQTTRVQALVETYIGLVELAVGLVPAGGGCKEMVIRTQEGLPTGEPNPDRWAPLHAAFQNIGLAKTSGSAQEAREMGFLRDQDGISINPALHLGDAKQLALTLVRANPPAYRPRADIAVLGEPGLSRFKVELHLAEQAGYISAHDRRLGTALATILCGGRLSGPGLVSEQYLLDLEREEFVSLCGEEKSRARIRHMLETGKPLRN